MKPLKIFSIGCPRSDIIMPTYSIGTFNPKTILTLKDSKGNEYPYAVDEATGMISISLDDTGFPINPPIHVAPGVTVGISFDGTDGVWRATDPFTAPEVTLDEVPDENTLDLYRWLSAK